MPAFWNPLAGTERRLQRVEQALIIILERLNKMALDFSRLESEIAENNSVVASAVTLIQAVIAEIRDAAANQTKVLELADKLDAQTNALAAAVASGTPADPAPVEPAA